jgi:hypothetical protein
MMHFLRIVFCLLLPVAPVLLAVALSFDKMPDPQLEQRLRDLTDIQNAIDAYKEANGSYPRSIDGQWSGPDNAHGASSDWIPGLAPHFIKSLPGDPRRVTPHEPYLYWSDGANYWIKTDRIELGYIDDVATGPLWREGKIEITPLDRIEIMPLEETAWKTVSAMVRREGGRLRIEGEPPFAAAYAAVSRRYRLPQGARVGAAGTVRRGGILIGLLNSQEQWAATIAIPPGPFRAAVEVPKDGEYNIVVANNLPAGETVNDAQITEIGLVGLDPAAIGIVSRKPEGRKASELERKIEITALEEKAWETLSAVVRREGGKLRIEGEPPYAAAYAAVSGRYRLPKGTLVGAAGRVRQGGIVLGLLDSQERWAATIAIPPGPFRTAVEVPKDGEYRIVVANNLPAGQVVNDAEITEIGLVGLDSADHRVAP